MANQIKVSSVSRDALTGKELGLDIMADVISTSREVLTGSGYGVVVFADALSVSRETLTGDGYGVNWFIGAASVVREMLIREAPFKTASSVREVLVSLPSEPLTQARLLASYRQAVLMLRPNMALPSTVKSPQIVPTLREQVLMRATRVRPTSYRFAQTLRMQVALHRNALAASQMHSVTRTYTFRQQVLQSRGKVYVPVSAVYVSAHRQMVVSHRATTPPYQVRTPIGIGAHKQLVALSRRVSVVLSSAYAVTLTQQAVHKATRQAPRSKVDSSALVQMVVQKYNVVPPGIDDRAGTLRQQVAIARVPGLPPFGVDHVAATVQSAVLARVAPIWISTTSVAGSVALAIQHRDTYAPAFAIGRHASTLHQQAVVARQSLAPHSYSLVGALRAMFTLKRNVPPPWDVIDPSVGRHAASLRMLAVQHRVTIPPDVIRTQSRYVFCASEVVALGDDTFPAPDIPPPIIEIDANSVGQVVMVRDASGWEPVSSMKSESVAEAAVIGDADGWIDATVPQSDTIAHTLAQQVAMGDQFPGSTVPQCDAVVAALWSTAALGDSTLPDPTIPASEISTRQAVEIAALGDAQFPDPLIPLSEVRSCVVGAFCALGDPNLSGQFGMSEISAASVAEMVVVPDRSLVGIPLRKGPRPVITVSIS